MRRRTWAWVGVCLMTLGCGDTRGLTVVESATTKKVFDSRDGQYQPGDRAVVAGTPMTALWDEDAPTGTAIVLLRPGVEVTVGYDPGESEDISDPEGDTEGKGRRLVDVTLVTGPDAGRSGKVMRYYLRPINQR